MGKYLFKQKVFNPFYKRLCKNKQVKKLEHN